MSNLIKVVPVIAVGVTLFVNDYTRASFVAFVGTTLLAGVLAWQEWQETRRRRAAKRMSEWLVEAAQYGTRYIQNATDWDVTNARDVPRLSERHERWVTTIRAHAARRLEASDADHVSMFHTFAPKSLGGFNAEHARIKTWTAERVIRLRDVAKRLQDGTATVKSVGP